MKPPMPTPIPSSASRIVRILIVDDMPQVRRDLRELIEFTKEIIVIGEAVNGLDAVRQIRILHPDVVVMDLEMPVMNGYEATRLIKQQGLAKRVIILTIHSGDAVVQRIQQAGADAYVQKGSGFKVLIEAILKSE